MKLYFVRSIRGLQNFLAIPIMNPLAGFMIGYAYRLETDDVTHIMCVH